MSRIWYPRYTGDFMRKTAHLSMTEIGAYNRMLDHYYSTDKPLPGDIEAVRRIAGAHNSDEIKAVDAVLAEFFELNGNNYHNRRADKELGRADTYNDRAKKAAAARWGDKDKPHHDEKAAPPKPPVEYPNKHVKAIFECDVFRGVRMESVAKIVHDNEGNPRFKTNMEEFIGDAANLIVSGELPRDWNPPTRKLKRYLESSGPPASSGAKGKRSVTFE